MKRAGANGPNLSFKSIVMRYVTENRAMPRGRKPEGEQALSNAERQARYRDRHTAPVLPATSRARRAADRRSRPQRWRDAVNELLTIQATYADWLTALPDGLRDSSIAASLEAIVELDLGDLAEIELPRGYGRD
jgi:hypothetical protein